MTRRCLRSLYPGCDIVRSAAAALIHLSDARLHVVPFTVFLDSSMVSAVDWSKATLLCKSLAEFQHGKSPMCPRQNSN